MFINVLPQTGIPSWVYFHLTHNAPRIQSFPRIHSTTKLTKIKRLLKTNARAKFLDKVVKSFQKKNVIFFFF